MSVEKDNNMYVIIYGQDPELYKCSNEIVIYGEVPTKDLEGGLITNDNFSRVMKYQDWLDKYADGELKNYFPELVLAGEGWSSIEDKVEQETYRLEMIIFRNFNGTKKEAQDELQGDADGFESNEYGWISENYMAEDPYLIKLEPYKEKE